jgi:hypothetical protein
MNTIMIDMEELVQSKAGDVDASMGQSGVNQDDNHCAWGRGRRSPTMLKV